MSNWRTFNEPESFRDLPSGGGCYAIYLDGKLSYVGQASNVKERIRFNHRVDVARYSSAIVSPWGRFQTVSVKVRVSKKFGDWAMIELRLIRRLLPRFNNRGTGRPQKKRRKRHA
jgi:excinuclease UvrABC nuclease subunit